MRCERLDGLLPAYLDGDLPSRLNRAVSDHLDACVRCQRELDLQQRAHRVLDAAHRPVAIDLWPEFSRRLQAQSLHSRGQGSGVKRLAAIAFHPLRWRPGSGHWRFLWQPGVATALAAVAVGLIARSSPDLAPLQLSPTPARPSVQITRVAEPDLGARTSRLPDRSGRDARAPRSGPEETAAGNSGTASARLRTRRWLPTTTQRPARERPVRSRRVRLAGATAPGRSPGTPAAARRTAAGRAMSVAAVPRSAPSRLVRVAKLPDRPLSSNRLPTRDSAAGTVRLAATDPLYVAEALVNAQQDAARVQMEEALLRMAQEVVRVSGEPAAAGLPIDGSRT